MREIKFRAWSKVANMFLDITGFETEKGRVYGLFHDGDYIGYDKEDIHLMQYTGLKDKNGKDIYEGDILESISGTVGNPEAKVRSIYEVVLDDRNSYAFGTRKKGRTHITSPIFRSATKYYKVIGNIYENPELLKTK